ncbi:MAG: ATP-binding cassette domain-containing protein [Lachnospiraceae bacterium]
MKINHLLKRDIFALSGGEKQKIAFASIYAMNPAVFLLDEPSSNLDIRSIEDLRTHLQIIKQEGKTIVIAEHRLYYLLDLVDRIIYLSDGQIEGIFTPQEFTGLTDNAKRAMGLRTMNLAAVNPSSYAQTAPKKVLKLRDVALQYQKRTIVQNINLEAAAGEIIAVVGHNGAGKTTFSRALCGLHKEQTGQFLWQNTPLNKKDRTKYSYMVMQDVNYQLFADSVSSECTLGIKNADPALVEQTLAVLCLLPFRECHPNTLSGGQKQRVAVAVSMICDKLILVFDEPTSGLDYDSMSDVAGLIKKLAAKEKIVFIVTHDYEFICQTCTRVLHIDEGELLEDYAVSEDNEQRIRKLFAIRKEK